MSADIYYPTISTPCESGFITKGCHSLFLCAALRVLASPLWPLNLPSALTYRTSCRFVRLTESSRTILVGTPLVSLFDVNFVHKSSSYAANGSISADWYGLRITSHLLRVRKHSPIFIASHRSFFLRQVFCLHFYKLKILRTLCSDFWIHALSSALNSAPLASKPVWSRDFASSEELVTEFCRECRIVRKGLLPFSYNSPLRGVFFLFLMASFPSTSVAKHVCGGGVCVHLSCTFQISSI